MAPTVRATGGCLCGGVQFEIRGPMRPVVYCHCSQCRKTSGHYVAATACSPDDIEIFETNSLWWYESSPHARRGFCGVCGGNLFWRPTDGGHVSVMAGTIDAPTGLQAIAHIYTGSASDYYDIGDGLPQYEERGSSELDSEGR